MIPFKTLEENPCFPAGKHLNFMGNHLWADKLSKLELT